MCSNEELVKEGSVLLGEREGREARDPWEREREGRRAGRRK